MHGFHNLEYRCSFVAANSADLSPQSSWRENSLLQVFAVANRGFVARGIIANVTAGAALADLPPVVAMPRFPGANEPCRKHAFAITSNAGLLDHMKRGT